MTLGGLFSGIGGFELAAQWAGITPLWSNEIDRSACNVLRKNFTHEIIEKDIREIGRHNLHPVDIICGGFPCQPFSSAGHRRGKEDDRYLWPEMLRIVKELKPTWVIGENVAGLASMGQPGLYSVLESETVGVTEEDLVLPEIIGDLKEGGYEVQIFNIPACGFYAEHRRERLWIVAYSSKQDDRERNGSQKEGQESELGKCIISNSSAYSNGEGLPKRNESRSYRSTDERIISRGQSIGVDTKTRWWEWEAKPVLSRADDGISGRVDRIKQLGNAIYVPIAYQLLKSIKSLY